MKTLETKVYSLDIGNGKLNLRYIDRLNGRNVINDNLIITTNEGGSNVKILVPSEAKIEVSIANGTTVRHPEYLGKIVPYETNGKKVPFEINCKCFYEREVVDYSRVEKYLSVAEKKELFSGKSIGENGLGIKPAWETNECVISRYDNVSLIFDGNKLSLVKNGSEVKYWQAMSGRKGFNTPEYQRIKNKGPLPEGAYDLRRSQVQNYDDSSAMDRVKGLFGGGKWPGGTRSWDKHRIWLDPEKDTQTYGRSGFSVHGGSEFGSAGCIDLAGGIESFMQDYNKITSETGKDLKVQVQY